MDHWIEYTNERWLLQNSERAAAQKASPIKDDDEDDKDDKDDARLRFRAARPANPRVRKIETNDSHALRKRLERERDSNYYEREGRKTAAEDARQASEEE